MEASNKVEQVLWIVITTSAFAMAGIMIESNIRDVKENPIAISIDTIPVQVIAEIILIAESQ